MTRFIQEHRRIWPGLAALCLLIVMRMFYTWSPAFSFLFWNLLLALLPLWFSDLAVTSEGRIRQWGCALLWLLFFPNSAYLFTDMIHLNHSAGLLYWVDMMILVLSAIYGLVLCMRSLRVIEQWYGAWLKPGATGLVSFVLLLACGYGIYLGRVERWNSWDVVAQPVDLFHAICYHYRHPFRCREVWMMSALFGGGLYSVYLLFRKYPASVQHQVQGGEKAARKKAGAAR